MRDNVLELDMFKEAYDKAAAANASGDVAAAKRYFMRAAELMESIADNSDPPLDVTRKERAQKLKYIAENLTAQASLGADAKSEPEQAQTEAPSFMHFSKPNEKVAFDDIIGLDEAKAAIHRLLIDPLNNPQAYSKYGIKAGGFILLEGPPGTGKTTFAKAAASELDVPFADVDANSLVDSYIGKTGKNIDRMFESARVLSRRNGTPVVLFLDEIDYLAQKRGGENKTAAEAVPALIKQMDGFSSGSDDIVLIAATNIKNTLDPAILSRFRNVINIPLPTGEERMRMFGAKLKMLDAADFAALDLQAAADASEGFSGRDIAQAALELKSALAARDAGLAALSSPLSDALLDIIAKRAKAR
ncbi:MAG: ATP-binding protein [Roseburia sp.]|nr:ATP-binding protein [Roseburia sp.]